MLFAYIPIPIPARIMPVRVPTLLWIAKVVVSPVMRRANCPKQRKQFTATKIFYYLRVISFGWQN